MEVVALASWAAVLALFAVVGAPIATAVFERLPGGGGHFAIHAGLLAMLLITFWIGRLRYGFITILVAVLLLGGLSGLLYYRGVRPGWMAVAEGYVAFLVGFIGAILFRATGPTLTPQGGEQFLHFGLLNAVGQTDALPPADMWFAGENVQYYYGGHVLTDAIATLARVDPAIAYNLGLATVFGLATAAAFGLVGAVVERLGHARRLGGFIGAAMLVAAGTLTTPVRLLFGHLPESFATRHGEFAFEAIRTNDPLPEVIADQGSLGSWFWWHDRYVVVETLQEFPMYSLAKGDLHGHVTTIPFMVVLVAIAYAYYLTPREAVWRRRMLAFGVFPAAAGAVGWMNTWSLPGAVGIVWLGLAFADAHPWSLLPKPLQGIDTPIRSLPEPLATGWRATVAAGMALIAGVLALAWIAPFVLFELPTNDGIGVLPERSPIDQQLLVWGAFFGIFGAFLAGAVWDRLVERRNRVAGGLALGGGIAAMAVIALAGAPSLAIGAVLLVGAWWLARVEDRVGFAGVLIVGGLGLVLVMEVLYADVYPFERERWNTTYKVSMQAWILCALAAGTVVTVVLGEAKSTILASTPRWRTVSVSAIVIVLVIAMAVFPVMLTANEFGDYVTGEDSFSADVDGLETLEWTRSDELEAVQWLADREDTPTLLEGPGDPPYRWTNIASTFTGYPSVVGWEHQRGYRGDDAYEQRVAEVDEMYTGEIESTVALLQDYDVDYIWVGEHEHERYGPWLLDFGEIDGIDLAFVSGDVRVYSVDIAGERAER